MAVPYEDDPVFDIQVAADLARMLADFGQRDEETSAGSITIRALSPEGDEAVVKTHPVDFARALTSAWNRAMVHARPESNPFPLECCVYFPDWDETGKDPVSGYLMWVKESQTVRFALTPDFSDSIQVGEWSPRDPGEPPLDSGVVLLQSITARELAGVEPILAELWRAIDEGSLTGSQRHQITAMAELIRAEAQATVPEVTEPWKLIGTVGSALAYLVKEAPRDALAW